MDTIRDEGGDVGQGGAEYWPVMNEWVIDKGPVQGLALHNINRTVEAVIRDGFVTLSEDGYLHLTELGARRCPR